MRNQNHEGCIKDSLKQVYSLHEKLSEQPARTTSQKKSGDNGHA